MKFSGLPPPTDQRESRSGTGSYRPSRSGPSSMEGQSFTHLRVRQRSLRLLVIRVGKNFTSGYLRRSRPVMLKVEKGTPSLSLLHLVTPSSYQRKYQSPPYPYYCQRISGGYDLCHWNLWEFVDPPLYSSLRTTPLFFDKLLVVLQPTLLSPLGQTETSNNTGTGEPCNGPCIIYELIINNLGSHFKGHDENRWFSMDWELKW